MNSLAGIDMGRILLNLSNELFKQLDDLEVQRNLPHSLARCQKHWLLLFAIDLPGIDLPLPVIAPHEEDYAAPRDHQVA